MCLRLSVWSFAQQTNKPHTFIHNISYTDVVLGQIIITLCCRTRMAKRSTALEGFLHSILAAVASNVEMRRSNTCTHIMWLEVSMPSQPQVSGIDSPYVMSAATCRHHCHRYDGSWLRSSWIQSSSFFMNCSLRTIVTRRLYFPLSREKHRPQFYDYSQTCRTGLLLCYMTRNHGGQICALRILAGGSIFITHTFTRIRVKRRRRSDVSHIASSWWNVVAIMLYNRMSSLRWPAQSLSPAKWCRSQLHRHFMCMPTTLSTIRCINRVTRRVALQNEILNQRRQHLVSLHTRRHSDMQ